MFSNTIIAKEKTIDNKNRFYYPKRCFLLMDMQIMKIWKK